MILAAALAAGAIAAAPPSAIVPLGATVERTPNLYQQPANCRAVVEGEVARQKVALKGLIPMGQYAVDRRLDGCSVPTPVGYHPAAAAAAPDAVDAVKREGAPSNRR